MSRVQCSSGKPEQDHVRLWDFAFSPFVFLGQWGLFASLVCFRAYGYYMPANNVHVMKLPADTQAKSV